MTKRNTNTGRYVKSVPSKPASSSLAVRVARRAARRNASALRNLADK